MSGWADAPFAGRSVDGDDGALITPRIERGTFRGPDGLRDLRIAGRFESLDIARFEAEIVRVQLGALVLRRTAITPHRAIVDGREPGRRGRRRALHDGAGGQLLAAPPGGRPMRMGVGDALFTCRPRGVRLPGGRAAGRGRVDAAGDGPARDRPPARRPADRAARPHPSWTRSWTCWSASRERLDESWSFDTDYAARGLIDLETAILTGDHRAADSPAGPRPRLHGRGRLHRAASRRPRAATAADRRRRWASASGTSTGRSTTRR